MKNAINRWVYHSEEEQYYACPCCGHRAEAHVIPEEYCGYKLGYPRERFCSRCGADLRNIKPDEMWVDYVEEEYINKNTLIVNMSLAAEELQYEELDGAVKMIHEVEKVKPAKVKRILYGKWTEKESSQNTPGIFCSVCGSMANEKYSFCPNCGAEMKQEVKKND